MGSDAFDIITAAGHECACVSHDARECIRWRCGYPCLSDDEDYYDERCECPCHDEDEGDEDL